jgi:hypothetical protein
MDGTGDTDRTRDTDPTGRADRTGGAASPGPRPPGRITLIVDGANVMGSRADGWWRDRAAAMARLHNGLAALAENGITVPPPDTAADGDPGAAGDPGAGPAPAAERWFPLVILVTEGRSRAAAGIVEARAEVRLAAAPGAGDDEIARLAAEVPGPRLVVTADRQLRRRCEAAGAGVVGPRWLTRLLP